MSLSIRWSWGPSCLHVPWYPTSGHKVSRSALWFPREWFQWVAWSRTPISGVSVLQLLTAQLCGSPWPPRQQHWAVHCCVVSAPSLSASPLQITTTGMFLDVAWRQHMNWRVGGGRGVWGCEPSHLEASMEFHREKHLVPFLWAGSNVRRQNVSQWVNLQLLLFRGHKDAPHPRHFPAALLTPVPLSKASAYMHNFIIISGQVTPAAFSRFSQGGDSFSHTLRIMFASFQWTNTVAASATICPAGRIFNYFSRPCHLGVCSRTFSSDIVQRCQLKS